MLEFFKTAQNPVADFYAGYYLSTLGVDLRDELNACML